MKVKTRRPSVAKSDRKYDEPDDDLIHDLICAGATVGTQTCIFSHPSTPKVNGRPTLLGWLPVPDPKMEYFALGHFSSRYTKLFFFSRPGYFDNSQGVRILLPAMGVA